MSVRRRRALVAAALPALLLPAGVASAVCPSQELCATFPGAIEIGEPPSGGDGSGVLCEYVKDSAPPPSDWTGDPNSPAPYVFTRTQAWGTQHPGEYDIQVCVPLCVSFNSASDFLGCLPT